MMARVTNANYFAIGEDKLQRLRGIQRMWMQTQQIIIDREPVDVGEFVELTFHKPSENGTQCFEFWVVPPGHIRNADVILGVNASERQRRTVRGEPSPYGVGMRVTTHERRCEIGQ